MNSINKKWYKWFWIFRNGNISIFTNKSMNLQTDEFTYVGVACLHLLVALTSSYPSCSSRSAFDCLLNQQLFGQTYTSSRYQQRIRQHPQAIWIWRSSVLSWLNQVLESWRMNLRVGSLNQRVIWGLLCLIIAFLYYKYNKSIK